MYAGAADAGALYVVVVVVLLLDQLDGDDDGA